MTYDRCPKCARGGTGALAQCPGCGLVFAKYAPLAPGDALRGRRAASRGRGVALVAGLLVLLAGIALFAVANAPSPHVVAIDRPALGSAVVLAGNARGELAQAASVRLVDSEGRDVGVAGALAADGSFRIELPADPGVVRATAASIAASEALFARSTTPEATWRPMLERAKRDAGHRLRADWAELDVDPPEMIVGQFGLALDTAPQRGDLVATDSDPGAPSATGERILCWVWADRAGRVRGRAYSPVELGEPRFNEWDLELAAGWNVVSSVQQDDGISLRYETTPIPPGLEWRAVVPDATNSIRL